MAGETPTIQHEHTTGRRTYSYDEAVLHQAGQLSLLRSPLPQSPGLLVSGGVDGLEGDLVRLEDCFHPRSCGNDVRRAGGQRGKQEQSGILFEIGEIHGCAGLPLELIAYKLDGASEVQTVLNVA